MIWLDRLEQALTYIEQNLEQEISLEELGRIACCSPFHFQRMFSYLAEMPLALYIRRRRMTRAAFDLQKGGKVLEIALKYGYDSPTSFARAFQSVHGIPPSHAKAQGSQLKAYPRIHFQIQIKGDTEMNYRIEQKEAFRVVGKKITLSADGAEASNLQAIPAFWGGGSRPHPRALRPEQRRAQGDFRRMHAAREKDVRLLYRRRQQPPSAPGH